MSTLRTYVIAPAIDVETLERWAAKLHTQDVDRLAARLYMQDVERQLNSAESVYSQEHHAGSHRTSSGQNETGAVVRRALDRSRAAARGSSDRLR